MPVCRPGVSRRGHGDVRLVRGPKKGLVVSLEAKRCVFGCLGPWAWTLSLLRVALLGLAFVPGAARAQSTPACEETFSRTPEALFDFDHLRAVTDLARFDGLTLGKVEIVPLPIFNTLDPREDHRLYDFINSLHVNTQPYVINHQLLFASGQPFSAQRMEESERILRDNPFFQDAVIVPWRVCGDTVDVLVVTRDLWTLLPKLSYSRTGGDTEWGVEIEDTNIVGTGTQLSFAYYSERERNTARVFYRHPHVAQTRMVFSVGYGESTDGYDRGIELTRPFYSLDARWSAGITARELKLEESLEQSGELTNSFDHITNEYRVHAARSTGLVRNMVQRFWVGFAREENLFEATDSTIAPPPTDRVLAYPWAAISVSENEYTVFQNLNSLYRTEDIATGASANFLLGWADEAVNSDLNQWVVQGSFVGTPVKKERHLWRVSSELDAKWDRDERAIRNSVATVATTYFHFPGHQWRQYAGLRYDHGKNLAQDELLPLGGEQGLRGYPTEHALGERRLLINLEQRYYFKAHWFNLLRFGAVAFFDMGRTWQEQGVVRAHARLLRSAGVGLRINSSKTSIGRIIHMDLAFPLDEREQLDPYQWTIGAEGTF